MKTILILITMLFPNHCPAQGDDWTMKTQPGIGEQLARMITPPDCEKRRVLGIVMVQFQISEDLRICRVRVHSNDETISGHLIRQLTGQKLFVLYPDFLEVHTIKVHFQRPEQS
ncbi:hypothetical protein [Spirosoma luteum]|uniref:hypothetical protein n=1 Tax=Spirosoma luteum TaxID=431553 RepID=UPI00037598B5|nr:hypothetical protein [Spirosoma luteum]